MDAILVLNAGSSSVKFAAFEVVGLQCELRRIGKGHVARVAAEIEWFVEDASGTPVETSSTPCVGNGFDHGAAMAEVLSWIDVHRDGLTLAAVGHRVVHGGVRYAAPIVVTDAVLRDLEALVPWAPLHQPHNLQPIRIVSQRWPGVPQVACFDTAFHHTQPAVAQAFALPPEITDAGVRRYGFHGLSCEYIATQLSSVLGSQVGRGRVIVAHLGNGASLCAMVDGQSVASTMGFSALDGLVMGTRCGTLDAGVVLHLLQHLGMTVPQVSDLLYSRSGLLGVSGISSDMQVLLNSTDPRAAQAIELFVYRVVGEIGSLTAAMGGLDALVFTAGIGEHAAAIRSRTVAACAWLGAVIDDTANDIDLELIHALSSTVRLAVIPTDEESMIARQAATVIAALPQTSLGLRK